MESGVWHRRGAAHLATDHLETIALSSLADAPAMKASPLRRGLAFAGLGFLWLILCRHLSSEWSINEQYSYGWFVPFFAAYVFWLRWQERPWKVESGKGKVEDPQRPFSFATFPLSTFVFPLLFLLLLPLRLFEVGNPDWRPLGWVHAAIVVGLTLMLIWRIGGTAWLKHFAFPVCFIFVAVPWISALEMPVIQGLMRSVAAIATETLNLFGVPAQLEGNLIRVRTGLVGVNEACSGVRSLQTSLMIGLLFGELKRLNLNRRLLLVLGALLIALVANCLRALFLVSLAATEAGAVDRWHDQAGYAIVAAVFIGTIGIAALLGKGDSKAERRTSEGQRRNVLLTSDVRPLTFGSFPLSTFHFALCLLWLPGVEVAVETWYRVHERDLTAETPWTVQWPTTAVGFHGSQIDEGVRRTLRFDTGSEARWTVAGPTAVGASAAVAPRCVGYFFRWNAGGSSVVRARAHRPDICLPSAGWEQIADHGVARVRVGDLVLPFRHVSFRQQQGNGRAETFFCLQEDQRRPGETRPDLQMPLGAQPDWSFPSRARVVRHGIRNLGQQVLQIALISFRPLDPEAAQREFSDLLQNVIVPARKQGA